MLDHQMFNVITYSDMYQFFQMIHCQVESVFKLARFFAEEFDRGQTREICEKQEKYLKGKAVTFTVQSLILCQYPVDLLTFLEL